MTGLPDGMTHDPEMWFFKGHGERRIEKLPTPLLIGLLKAFNFRRQFQLFIKSFGLEPRIDTIARVLRERGVENHYLNRVDTPACACGRVAHYLVGRKTYCRKCKDGAVGHLNATIAKHWEARSQEIDSSQDDMDVRARRREQLRRRGSASGRVGHQS